MNSALYSSATALKAFSSGLGVIGNNLANSSTVGYKQQTLQYDDLIYAAQGNLGAYNNSQEGVFTSMGQTGMGVQVGSIRTVFSEGGYEISNSTTDIAIGGKGFFQVVDDQGRDFYTRAGNFHFDNEGILKTHAGLSLSGYKFDKDGVLGEEVGPIQINPFDKMPPQATSETTFLTNLGFTGNNSHDETDPYFSLLKQWDATTTGAPLKNGSYGHTTSVKAYDAEGKSQDLNIYFDSVSDNGQHRVIEFVVGTNPGDKSTDSKDGLLMTGTLTFNAAGQLINMNAFTPTGADKSDLSSWTPAELSEAGLPQYTLDGQTITLDLGISSASGWTNMPESAAAVGKDKENLGSINPKQKPDNEQKTTAHKGQSFSPVLNQNGYGEGSMSTMHVNSNGQIIVAYTNNQSQMLYQIPVARFVSEDGLHREGGNLFSAPEAAGLMELGMAGTENYGETISGKLEMSNVEMSKEMVSMIITQRSFQSSSKAITTADEMLQKAIELKR